MTKQFAIMLKSVDAKRQTVNPKRRGGYFIAFLITFTTMMLCSLPASAQITDSLGDTFELSARGQVRECTVTSCTALTGTNTFASQLVATGSGTSSVTLYMLANNGGVNQVWQYTGSGTDWTPITGTNTIVTTVVATNSAVYMLANNSGPNHVWNYSGSGTDWTAITGLNTTVFSIWVNGNTLSMYATNGGPPQTWVYTGSGTDWIPIPLIQ